MACAEDENSDSAATRDALWVVFDHRLVVPEYIVEFDLLPCDEDKPHACLPQAATRSTAVPSPELVAANELHSDTSEGLQPGRAHSASPVPDCASDSELEVECAMGYDSAAAVAAVQRQAPEVGQRCRELGGFLWAAEHLGSDEINPALVPLPRKIRAMASAALALPPQVCRRRCSVPPASASMGLAPSRQAVAAPCPQSKQTHSAVLYTI
jgi:rhodanese-related sulfurtransferase